MTYDYITYADNWSFYRPNGNGYAGIAPGVNGATAFAVCNDDGNLDVRFPVAKSTETYNQGINPNATYALAVGGWNNSNLDPTGAQNMGLWNVMTNSPGSFIDPNAGLTGTQRMLINTLFVAAQPATYIVANNLYDLPYPPSGDPQLTPQQAHGLGFTAIIIDFEGFLPITYVNPKMVTHFMTALASKLPAGTPLHMALPGYVSSQAQYLDMPAILTACPDIKFHLMLYDYAAGVPLNIVTSNASLSMSYDAIVVNVQYAGSFLSQCFIGFPNYGRGFVIGTNLNPTTLAQNIAQGYPFQRYTTPSDGPFAPGGLITDDDIMSLIGSWDSPSNGWTLITVATSPRNGVVYNDYYYYNSSTGVLITAFPNGTKVSSIIDLAQMILDNFKEVYGFMNWEAESEANQNPKKMTSLIAALSCSKKAIALRRDYEKLMSRVTQGKCDYPAIITTLDALNTLNLQNLRNSAYSPHIYQGLEAGLELIYTMLSMRRRIEEHIVDPYQPLPNVLKEYSQLLIPSVEQATAALGATSPAVQQFINALNILQGTFVLLYSTPHQLQTALTQALLDPIATGMDAIFTSINA